VVPIVVEREIPLGDTSAEAPATTPGNIYEAVIPDITTLAFACVVEEPMEEEIAMDEVSTVSSDRSPHSDAPQLLLPPSSCHNS